MFANGTIGQVGEGLIDSAEGFSTTNDHYREDGLTGTAIKSSGMLCGLPRE